MDTETCEIVTREEIVGEDSTKPVAEMSVESMARPQDSLELSGVAMDSSSATTGAADGAQHSLEVASSENFQNVTATSSVDATEDKSILKSPLMTDSNPSPTDTASDNHSRSSDDALCGASTAPCVKVESSTRKDEKEQKKSGGSDDDDDSELARAQRVYQANPESYNGAIRQNYSWSQSIADLDVRVKVPDFVKSSKKQGVSVKVDRKHLRVTYKDLLGSEVVVIDRDLSWEVLRDESTWSLVPGEQVHISMEKVQERWWDALLEGEPKISTRKIDPSRPITDLGDEEQAKIAEMMYNERQKRLGLPQSHEQKTHELLKKAWDADGSPFKGQPFDPSKLNISTGGF